MNDTAQNQLAAIKSKYAGCNLLMPSASEVQLNPFYKITVMEVLPDLSEQSGDIFKVGRIQEGKDWVDLYSPAKPLLMKLASAAGIQFDPNNTYGTRVSKNCYKAKAFGAMRLPDGTGKTHADEKTIDLEDEEDRFRLEFMDKSIEGIKDKRAAEEAAKMFAGEWFDTTDKWGKPCKGYRIADQDRQKYIDRSVLVNMTLLRKTAAEKAMTGAILRVIRALVGMKGQYTRAELSKPFAVARVTFSPDYSDPEVRRAMLEQGMNSMGNMFGTSGALPHGIGSAVDASFTTTDSLFDPEEFANNPAFASEGGERGGDHLPPEHDGYYDEPQGQRPAPRTSRPEPTPDPAAGETPSGEQLECIECSEGISKAVYDFSVRKYGAPLCMKCQKNQEGGK